MRLIVMRRVYQVRGWRSDGRYSLGDDKWSCSDNMEPIHLPHLALVGRVVNRLHVGLISMIRVAVLIRVCIMSNTCQAGIRSAI